MKSDQALFTKLEICEALTKRFCKNCKSSCTTCKIREVIVTIARMEKTEDSENE